MLVSIATMTEYDPTIWNDLTVPSPLNKQDLVDMICFNCAELELLYHDPDILKYMIRNWSRTENYIWQKMANTLNLQYNPIYNLDVTYEETRTPNLTRTRTPNLTETRTPNINEVRTPNITENRSPNITETETPTDTTTEAVAGFNASTFENSRQTTRGGTITNATTGTDSTTTTGSESVITNGIDTRKETGTDTTKETGSETVNVRRFGNQGVTMTQDMIQKEREVAQFSLYEYIANSFKNRFCLLVY